MDTKQLLSDGRYAFYVLTHPFDGMWDLKHEKKGRMWIAVSALALWILSNILRGQATGFLYNSNVDAKLDFLLEVRNVLLIFFLFVFGNWSVTTLMDGKGTLRDIVIAFGYACLPISLLQIPCTLLSNALTYDGSVFLSLITAASWLWFFFLLFIGIMMIHDYSLIKNIFTVLLTLLGMLIIIFILILFMSLFSNILGFFGAIVKEMQMRV